MTTPPIRKEIVALAVDALVHLDLAETERTGRPVRFDGTAFSAGDLTARVTSAEWGAARTIVRGIRDQQGAATRDYRRLAELMGPYLAEAAAEIWPDDPPEVHAAIIAGLGDSAVETPATTAEILDRALQRMPRPFPAEVVTLVRRCAPVLP